MSWIANLLLHLPPPAIYLAIIAIVLAESVLLLSAFAPTFSTLLASGFLARVGTVQLALVIVSAVGAVVAGDLLAQRTGRRLGPRLSTGRLGRRIPSGVLGRTYGLLARRGGAAVFFCRFLPVVRTLAPHLAGSAGLRYRQLAPYSLVAGAVWASAEAGTGYLVGAAYPQVTAASAPVLGAAAALLLVLAAVLLLRRTTRAARPAAPPQEPPAEPGQWDRFPSRVRGQAPGCSQQATVRLSSGRSTGTPSNGSSLPQGSNALGQRGWKAQPLGIDRRSGGDPGMPVSSRRSPRSGGKACSRPSL